jgi:hypothetical protein
MTTLDEESEPVPEAPWALVKQCSRIRWCAGMTMALQGVQENSEGKGLSVSRGWIGQEKEPRRLGVVYNRRARDRNPLVLNACPWCGADIRFDKRAALAGGEEG